MNQHIGHIILDGLPVAETNWLNDRTKRVNLDAKQVLVEADEPCTGVWFLVDAICSVHARNSQGLVLGLMVTGKHRVVGADLFLCAQTSPHAIVVEQAGEAMHLEADGAEIASCAPVLFERLRWAASEDLRHLSRAAIHMAHANVTQRLAVTLEDRFLACEQRLIQTTHGHLAKWLAVRRATVTLALQELEAMKAIRSRRGTIELLDARRLSDIASGATASTSAPGATPAHTRNALPRGEV